MENKKNEAPSVEIPEGLSQPALRALSTAGITRLDQFTALTEDDLLKLHGIGPKAIGLIRDALAARGQFLAHASKRESSGEPVFDSPRDWVKSHIQSYLESDGKDGQLWRGFPALLLTTRGRKSGKLRRTALIYGRDGKNFLLVASNGGSPDHPMWYLNLAKDPRVEIQVGAEKFTARARTATAAEKPRLWKVMVEIFPRYDLYQEKAGREIPLIIVEPV